MSVFADTTGGDPTQDLNDISWCDGALGQGSNSTINVTGGVTPGAYTVTQVTYSGAGATTGMATADRLFTLVNSNAATGLKWASPILIMPVNGGLNPFTGADMTANGETIEIAGTPNSVITVVYDISNGGGAGIQGFDTGGNPIQTPRNVILYHELSHAFHIAINQIPFPTGQCSGNSSDEPAAEIDENVMRTQLGICQRDICNHNGGAGSGSMCGGTSRPPCAGGGGGSGGGGGGGCFIVSAATGSPESAEVIRLRRLRDKVKAKSVLSSQLIDKIYRQYESFSPAIASDLERNLLARLGILRVVVQPLLAWYTLAGALALDPSDLVTISHAAQDVLNACPRYMGMSIGPLLQAIREGSEINQSAPRLLVSYLPKIREAAQLPLASWAILDPLIRAWTLTTRHVDVVSEVYQWLASSPLEVCTLPSDSKQLDAEFGTLAAFFSLDLAAKRQLGARLAAAWPAAADSLKTHGFV